MVRSGFDHEPDIVPEDICLAHCDAPMVSVVIPTYGQSDFTLRCLASIQTHIPAVPIEVIVVDDAFPGDGAAVLARLQGVRLLRNTVNLGFLRTCNMAAKAARGAFLLFLNNDTEVVSPAWLDSMVEVFCNTARHRNCRLQIAWRRWQVTGSWRHRVERWFRLELWP